MSDDKQNKIDIPDSIERYKLTLFWGLTIMQVLLVFTSTLCIGFGIFSAVSRHVITTIGMFLLASAVFFGLFEIRGRNVYRHFLFLIAYYTHRPRVLIYHHDATSGASSVQAKQLVYQQEDNTKTFIFILIAVVIGLILLFFISRYVYHIIHS